MRGQSNTRQNRPLSAIIYLKHRAEGATYERLQRVVLVPNFKRPATPPKHKTTQSTIELLYIPWINPRKFIGRISRALIEASKDQPVAIVDVEQYAATFACHPLILSWINSRLILGHYLILYIRRKKKGNFLPSWSSKIFRSKRMNRKALELKN